MRLRYTMGLLLAAMLYFAAPASAGNLWPPRGYDKAVIAERNGMLATVGPATVDDQMPRYYALMHMAMFDAINSIERKSPALQSRVAAPRSASTDAAAAQAAHDVLIALFPTNALELDAE